MSRIHVMGGFLAVFCCCIALPLIVCGANPDGIRSKQQVHDKARALARDLLSTVLDIQLRQLMENGLEGQQVFGEIHAMRTHVDKLLNDEMEEVVELLVKAQEGASEDRQHQFTLAREKTRQVVVQLMAERQRLYRRLRVAKVAAQVQQLIELETKVYHETRGLPEQAKEQRERRLVTTIGTQNDIAALYLALVETLRDLATWDGIVATGAADGLRILKLTRVDEELSAVGQTLGDSQFEGAMKHELAVIKGLRALVEKLDETRGLISSDREAAIKLVQALTKKQEQLRELTRKQELTEQAVQDLVSRQEEIHRELADLTTALARYPTVEPLAEQSKEAAVAASNELFEQNKPQALREQGRVLGSLAQIEEQLRRATQADQSNKSADQLAAEIRRLESVQQNVREALQVQDQATQVSADQPQSAQEYEKRVSDTLAKNEPLSELPRIIESRLLDAREAVAEAQVVLQDSTAQLGLQRQGAAARASAAIRLADAEVASQLADTRRRHLAVKVGELARAAEALERASSAEKEVARAIAESAATDQLTGEFLQVLHDEQTDVATVADKIAAGVRESAPQVATRLSQLAPVVQQAQQQLNEAEQKPGADRAATSSAAIRAAESSSAVADRLMESAAQLRGLAGTTAGQLAELAEAQLQEVVQARESVERSADLQASSRADAGRRIEEARQIVRQARVDQLRASGRDAAADAQNLLALIEQVQRQQSRADKVQRDFQQGRIDSAIDVATEQQKVAELATGVQKASSGSLGSLLEQASKSATESAREQLNGSVSRADAARRRIADSLEQARRMAEEAAAQSTQVPAGTPDKFAQRRVVDQAESARTLIAQDHPAIQAALAQAKEQAAAATLQLDAKRPAEVGKAQENAAQALDRAASLLSQAASQHSAEERQRFRRDAERLGSLAEQSSRADAGASAALRQAERLALQASGSSAAPSGHPVPAESPTPSESTRASAQGHTQVLEEVQQAEARATASLAARETQLRRDRDIAETLARLANDQQSARDQISEASQQLADENVARAGSSPGDEAHERDARSEEQQRQAAQNLMEATRQFAEAQRATGQGAAEVSGQREVANQPIREGLEAASQLGSESASASSSSADGQMPLAPTESSQGDANASNPNSPNSPGSESSTADDPNDGNSQAAQGDSGSQSSQQPDSANRQERQLGMGLVPNSPEYTADRIAGDKALGSAEKALGPNSKSSTGKKSNSRGDSETGKRAGQSQQPAADSESASSSSAGTAAKGGAEQQNAKSTDAPASQNPAEKSDSRTADGQGAGAVGGDLKFDKEPWFAKLPPELRNAIQAKSRGKAPRGYEERLKRYFENID